MSAGLIGLVVLAVLVAGCGGSTRGDGRMEVLVSAASSLTESFGAIEEALEREHPELDVVLNLGGSATLREQILGGAPADVFASADAANMDLVVAGGAVAGDPAVFARNRLQIAVPPGNPAGVGGLDDFARAGLLIGLCAEQVPCGDLARQALRRAGVTAAVDTNEPNVRALLTKVEAGELDAGLVYVTDVVAADGRVAAVDLPPDLDVATDYVIAVLAGAPNPSGAMAFTEFVLSGAGQDVLASHGFAAP